MIDMEYFNVDYFDVFSGFDLNRYKEMITQTNLEGGFASLDAEHNE